MMAERSGIYFVSTTSWYIERMVWLIAGIDVTASTLLAVLHHPGWIFSIMLVSLSSITVGLTGFCVVGNVLYRFGMRPLVPCARTLRNGMRGRFYFMQTDAWYLERFIYIFVGVNLTIASLLARFLDQTWLCFTGFVGIAMIFFACTGFCIVANLLYRLGAQPRMQRPPTHTCAASSSVV